MGNTTIKQGPESGPISIADIFNEEGLEAALEIMRDLYPHLNDPDLVFKIHVMAGISKGDEID